MGKTYGGDTPRGWPRAEFTPTPTPYRGGISWAGVGGPGVAARGDEAVRNEGASSWWGMVIRHPLSTVGR